MFASSWLILFFPLAGFIALSWYGGRIPKPLVGLVGCGTVGASFLTSLVALSDLLFLPTEERIGKVHVLYQWVSAANWTDNEYKREKGVVLKEMARADNDIFRQVYRAKQQRYYKDSPYRYPVIGFRDTFTQEKNQRSERHHLRIEDEVHGFV